MVTQKLQFDNMKTISIDLKIRDQFFNIISRESGDLSSFDCTSSPILHFIINVKQTTNHGIVFYDMRAKLTSYINHFYKSELKQSSEESTSVTSHLINKNLFKVKTLAWVTKELSIKQYKWHKSKNF